MTNQITITMPIPPRCLSPNAANSRNFYAKSAARKEQRAAAMLYASKDIIGPGPRWERARFTIRWFAKDRARIPDFDNAIACCKGIFDGFADAQVILNDRGIEGVELWRVVDAKNPRLELTAHLVEPNGG